MSPAISLAPSTHESRVFANLHEYRALQWAKVFCRARGSTLARVIALSPNGAPTRVPRSTEIRRSLWALLVDTFDLSHSECARIFEVDRVTVLQAVRKRHAELEAEHEGRV